ncbi:uncharacterized protein A4U43_C01F6670 [Asparagus officinalis]|uniref:Nonsense-mediated mRNA decay factor SMG8 n=1 Tax=Asparagus officinalis TaxID=4686 RepID=A0A5P1FMK2_ASPOF|nr:uncharacterized protein A4U43_C01F6670 [Asparagus officinalis]
MAEQINSSSSPYSIRTNLSRQNPQSSAAAAAATAPTSSSSSSSTPSNSCDRGVVVVGFVGSKPTTSPTHLINRVLDANIFGSDAAKDLHRFRRHRITYYCEDSSSSNNKGILFLNLAFSLSEGSDYSLKEEEEFEFDHLQGLLFMFSVCHVIVFLHEGLRFDTQILKRFRVLQAAKHAFSPFIRSSTLLPKTSTTSISQPYAAPNASSSSISPTVRRTSRQSSSISLMSGSGSRLSVFPGQCVPVILFVFCDDFSDGLINPSPNMEDTTETQKSNLTLKGSGSVVMLARNSSKNEGSLKKKLHASLDAQIRFLLKKCRILVGSEPSLRGSSSVNSLPLFSLDAARVIVLADRTVNKRGESLDFITGFIEETLNSKGDLNEFIFGTQPQALNHEEIQIIADFIYRQSHILRGRGGLPSNANSAGVDHEFLDESGNIKKVSLQSSSIKMHDRQTSTFGSSAAEAAISCLESSIGLDMKFSVTMCKRALPAAKDVYLKDLPACYPSSLHNAHLEKALSAFSSMVKGPAVGIFIKKLEDDCTYIWTSGRQLCDAISLTGKPCRHQKHTVSDHSSGYFFLHACACGRSRGLREDPFDFNSANVDFNCFANCEDVLPTLVLPKGSDASPLPPKSWRLLRLGGARCYQPSRGLLQIGFCSWENFLLKCIISFDKQRGAYTLSTGATAESSVVSSTPYFKASTVVCKEKKKLDNSKFTKEVQRGGSDNQQKLAGMASSDDTSISFGKGLPSFTMKKPFSEVVAGTVLFDSTFPNLKSNKQQTIAVAKGGKQTGTVDQTDGQVIKTDGRQGSHRSEYIEVQESLDSSTSNYQTSCSPVLQIGSKLIPVNMCDTEKVLPNNSRKEVVLYVGFEHECSHGHRFLLSPTHLREFDSSYSTEVSERKYVKNSNVSHEEVIQSPYRTSNTASSTRRSTKSTLNDINYGQQRDGFTSFSREGTDKFQSGQGLSTSSDTTDELEGNLLHVRLDDGDHGLSLLNRNLPVYMNCPHCKSSTKPKQDIKFASSVSQLQRIFLVTPPLPTVLATCPVIQFEEKCLPPSTPVLEQKLCFTLDCQVILPPESFLVLRLPFIYGIKKGDGTLQPLSHHTHQPELSAWLMKGTALEVISMGHDTDEKLHVQ